MTGSEHIISGIRSERLAYPFYFISDTHISTRRGPEQDRRLNDMLTLLGKIKEQGGTLFILGDFFDFWFDKGNHIPKTLSPVVDALNALHQAGIEIHYLGGNHDYWIEGYLTREIGIRFYPDALFFDWDGKRIYCQHGDHIVYENSWYPMIRKIMRHPLAIGLLRCLPVRWTYALGEKVSHYNMDIPEIPQVTKKLVQQMSEFLKQKLEDGYDIALSGHVHKPKYVSDNGKSFAILGDWIHHRTYGLMDESGFHLADLKMK